MQFRNVKLFASMHLTILDIKDSRDSVGARDRFHGSRTLSNPSIFRWAVEDFSNIVNRIRRSGWQNGLTHPFPMK
ncbi:hypothetical protein BDN72DRAFT_584901 [Pluteus cervinus]|uniref:Uncharacterized protein n=1 Tax=Pluteus cervinus TaxID=181527 RepID=A0ACD3A2R8_9AGAR|nr:hypothetical protein BDN72DRAFT_584901 [Pluteus cervinus]